MTGNIHKRAGGRSETPRRWLPLLCAALILTGVNSCDRSLIYDYEGDCSISYTVQFRYDRNMKWADAFAHEVESVTLYVIDTGGRIVWHDTEAGSALAQDGYAMKVDVDPGEYSLLAWCGTKDNGSFTVADADEATGLTCALNAETDADGSPYVDGEVDRLYYGWLADQTFGTEPGATYVYTVPLTKDTNTVRVVLQHANGGYFSEDQYDFTITADNRLLDWDNSLIPDGDLTYRAFRTEYVEAEFDNEYEDTPYTFSGAMAEFTVGRLTEGLDARLTVTDTETGDVIISIPLVDYALLVKGFYNREMTDQEYLDRQDEYDLVFFLDDGNRWLNTYLYINSWMVVLQETDL